MKIYFCLNRLIENKDLIINFNNGLDALMFAGE